MFITVYGFVDYSQKKNQNHLTFSLVSDQELEVCTATYIPKIDQSQHVKSVNHIIRYGMVYNIVTIYNITKKCSAS